MDYKEWESLKTKGKKFMFKFVRNGIKFTKWSIILAIAVAAAGSCIPVYAARIQPMTSITITNPEE